jgi:hypothetical protein
MNLKQWKNKIALDTYKKKWDDLDERQQLSIVAKHRQQFYILARNKKERTT